MVAYKDVQSKLIRATDCVTQLGKLIGLVRLSREDDRKYADPEFVELCDLLLELFLERAKPEFQELHESIDCAREYLDLLQKSNQAFRTEHEFQKSKGSDQDTRSPSDQEGVSEPTLGE